MKSCGVLFLGLLFTISVATAQEVPKRPDLYHLHFAAAVPGKAVQLGEFLKTSSPADHSLILRHQYGSEWDYLVIEHLGTKATVEAAGTPAPASARDLYAWHADTFVNGPAWADFVKAMGLGEGASKSAASAYVVGTYRAIPGHRDQLEKMLSAAPSSGDPVSGAILMQHVEGAPWNFLTITRYNSWHDFATGETNSAAQTAKGSGGWYELREHAATHNDTLTDRMAR